MRGKAVDYQIAANSWLPPPKETLVLCLLQNLTSKSEADKFNSSLFTILSLFLFSLPAFSSGF